MNQGYSDAQNALGMLYNNGDGVSQSFEEAVRLWSMAAEQNNVIALNRLGEAYLNGNGVEKSLAEALSFFLRAANLGDANGQANVGMWYLMDENLVEAQYWYRLAAKQGHKKANELVAYFGW